MPQHTRDATAHTMPSHRSIDTLKNQSSSVPISYVAQQALPEENILHTKYNKKKTEQYYDKQTNTNTQRYTYSSDSSSLLAFKAFSFCIINPLSKLAPISIGKSPSVGRREVGRRRREIEVKREGGRGGERGQEEEEKDSKK
jgi:hypothetical protein